MAIKDQCKECKRFDKWIYLSGNPDQIGCEHCSYDIFNRNECIGFDPKEPEPEPIHYTLKDAIKFHLTKFSARYGYSSIDDICNDIVKYVEAHPVSPWISVNDRLPEIVNEEIPLSRTVLVRTNNDSQTIRRAVYYFDSGCWLEDRAGKIEIYNVTDWMEIPE